MIGWKRNECIACEDTHKLCVHCARKEIIDRKWSISIPFHWSHDPWRTSELDNDHDDTTTTKTTTKDNTMRFLIGFLLPFRNLVKNDAHIKKGNEKWVKCVRVSIVDDRQQILNFVRWPIYNLHRAFNLKWWKIFENIARERKFTLNKAQGKIKRNTRRRKRRRRWSIRRRRRRRRRSENRLFMKENKETNKHTNKWFKQSKEEKSKPKENHT